VWGREERTELAQVLRALKLLVPPAPPDAPGPFALSYEGALESLFERANQSSGPAALAIRTSGEAAVREAVIGAFAPFRTAAGGYRIETEWRWQMSPLSSGSARGHQSKQVAQSL